MSETKSTIDHFAALWDRELKELARRMDEADQRLLDALVGKPFWGTRPAGGKITGLAEYLPGPRVKPVGLETTCQSPRRRP